MLWSIDRHPANRVDGPPSYSGCFRDLGIGPLRIFLKQLAAAFRATIDVRSAICPLFILVGITLVNYSRRPRPIPVNHPTADLAFALAVPN